MSECKWDSNKHNGEPCPFHGALKADSLLNVDLLKDKGIEVSSVIPKRKSSYLHGGKSIYCDSESDHSEINRRIGIDLFSDFDNSKYNAVSVNAGLNGSRIVKIERADKKKGFHSLDSKVVRDIYASSPLFFFGWDVKPDVDHSPIKIGNVVSTLTHFMRIRAPNAAFLPPLTDIRK